MFRISACPTLKNNFKKNSHIPKNTNHLGGGILRFSEDNRLNGTFAKLALNSFFVEIISTFLKIRFNLFQGRFCKSLLFSLFHKQTWAGNLCVG